MALRLVPETLDPVDAPLPLGIQLRVVDPEMPEAGDVQSIAALPAIRTDNAVRDGLAPDEGCGADEEASGIPWCRPLPAL